MPRPVMFWKINEPNGCLSQWYHSPFSDHHRNQFSCAEQYMMYYKASYFNDYTIAKVIRTWKNAHPREYKKLGRRVSGFDMARWKLVCNDIVYRANMYKFSQNPKLLEFLLSTLDAELIEASSSDRLWGVGYDASTALENRDDWGENRLGVVLSRVRSDLADASVVESYKPKKRFIGFGD